MHLKMCWVVSQELAVCAAIGKDIGWDTRKHLPASVYPFTSIILHIKFLRFHMKCCKMHSFGTIMCMTVFWRPSLNTENVQGKTKISIEIKNPSAHLMCFSSSRRERATSCMKTCTQNLNILPQWINVLHIELLSVHYTRTQAFHIWLQIQSYYFTLNVKICLCLYYKKVVFLFESQTMLRAQRE